MSQYVEYDSALYRVVVHGYGVEIRAKGEPVSQFLQGDDADELLRTIADLSNATEEEAKYVDWVDDVLSAYFGL
ncbi:MAG TPA: hypothetical protein VIV12_23085 [Streptosporangiaceae bacterium]